jgi:hypothetical protein
MAKSWWVLLVYFSCGVALANGHQSAGAGESGLATLSLGRAVEDSPQSVFQGFLQSIQRNPEFAQARDWANTCQAADAAVEDYFHAYARANRQALRREGESVLDLAGKYLHLNGNVVGELSNVLGQCTQWVNYSQLAQYAQRFPGCSNLWEVTRKVFPQPPGVEQAQGGEVLARCQIQLHQVMSQIPEKAIDACRRARDYFDQAVNADEPNEQKFPLHYESGRPAEKNNPILMYFSDEEESLTKAYTELLKKPGIDTIDPELPAVSPLISKKDVTPLPLPVLK